MSKSGEWFEIHVEWNNEIAFKTKHSDKSIVWITVLLKSALQIKKKESKSIKSIVIKSNERAKKNKRK